MSSNQHNRYRSDDGDEQKMEDYLQEAIEVVDGLSVTAIGEGQIRRDYESTVREGADEIRAAVHKGQISAAEGAYKAHQMRNAALGVARQDSRAIGKSIAEVLKSHGPSFQELLENKAYRKFAKHPNTLTEAQLEILHLDIVESSKSTRTKFSQMVHGASGAGSAFLMFSVLLATAQLEDSHDKEDFMNRAEDEAVTLLGGWGGAELAGLAARGAFGPAKPLLVAACVLLGGFASAESAHRFAKRHFSHSKRLR